MRHNPTCSGPIESPLEPQDSCSPQPVEDGDDSIVACVCTEDFCNGYKDESEASKPQTSGKPPVTTTATTTPSPRIKTTTQPFRSLKKLKLIEPIKCAVEMTLQCMQSRKKYSRICLYWDLLFCSTSLVLDGFRGPYQAPVHCSQQCRQNILAALREKFLECQELNQGLLSEKRECYLCAMQLPPTTGVFRTC